jgi:ActR/RegA family two-component response regulator
MSNLSSDLKILANIPIDRLLPLAAEKLKHATLDELATILSGKATVVPSTDQLAEMILALPESGSKLARVQNAVVMHAFATCGGNVSAAARLLGMDRKELERKIARARRAAKRG